MNAIAAVSENWGLGKDNDLLFHISADMKRFRTLTSGGTVLMGRKTLESFPGGKPLPKRLNIVLTRNAGFRREGAVIVSTYEEALAAAADTEPDHLWVIGGGSVYAALLSQCKRVYLTVVDAEAEGADTFFPNLEELPEWEVESVSDPIEENGLTYRFVDYVNTAI